MRRAEEAVIVEKIRGEQIKRGVDPSEWVGGGPEEAMEEQEEKEEEEEEEEEEEGEKEEEISEEKRSEVDKPIATEVSFLLNIFYLFLSTFSVLIVLVLLVL